MATNEKTAISTVREIVRSAIWSVGYHEQRLPRAYSDLKFAKELLQRLDLEENKSYIYDENDEVTTFNNLEEFIMAILRDKEERVEYHEKSLRDSHEHLSFVMVMLARGNYIEINVDEIRAEVKKDLEDE